MTSGLQLGYAPWGRSFGELLENWAAFDDEAGFGAYRAALATLKTDAAWEAERVTQDDWWEFLDTKLFCDPPVEVGFRR